jgi:excisionase family DNA binding protein
MIRAVLFGRPPCLKIAGEFSCTIEESTMPLFLTVNDFISATKLSRPTVARKLKTNEIPHTRIGRKILIPFSFLKELEEKANASVSKVEV